jgi:hypothetical protein
MALELKHLEILDLLTIEPDKKYFNEWVSRIPQRDLYSIATWLMMNLTEESNQLEHKRTNVRDMLAYYYEQRGYNNLSPWTDKQKWFIAYEIINFWPHRQLENDPRYLM